MKKSIVAACVFVWLASFTASAVAEETAKFNSRVVAAGLADPWEVALGPDGYLWITERTGKRITRIHPETGEKLVALTIPEVHQDVAQDGLLGMALHPQLLKARGKNNYVYIFFTYEKTPQPNLVRAGKLRRYTYDEKSATLKDPMDLLSGLPVHNDHVAGRLAFGPDNKLYLSIGDQGSNFGTNACNPNRAQETPSAAEVRNQDWLHYQGKLLRINLDGSIPRDNPVINGVRSHVYTYGHRNIQGIAFGAGKTYAAEQGPSTDDEINLMRAGGNYGWPNVAGYRDDRAYVYGNWSAAPNCRSLPFDPDKIPAEVPKQKESEWNHPDFVPPIQTFFTVDDNSRFRADGNATAALSGMVYYGSTGIPGWANSLLVTGMRAGTVYRLKLSADGRTIAGQPENLFRGVNRPRDLAISPDGKKIYMITDVTGRVTLAPGVTRTNLENPGTLFEFTYAGSER